jgi:hypothetical protein
VGRADIVGESVGEKDGDSVGSDVGVADGFLVGAFVGTCDKLGFILIEGGSEGSIEGWLLGLVDITTTSAATVVTVSSIVGGSGKFFS